PPGQRDNRQTLWRQASAADGRQGRAPLPAPGGVSMPNRAGTEAPPYQSPPAIPSCQPPRTTHRGLSPAVGGAVELAPELAEQHDVDRVGEVGVVLEPVALEVLHLVGVAVVAALAQHLADRVAVDRQPAPGDPLVR